MTATVPAGPSWDISTMPTPLTGRPGRRPSPAGAAARRLIPRRDPDRISDVLAQLTEPPVVRPAAPDAVPGRPPCA